MGCPSPEEYVLYRGEKFQVEFYDGEGENAGKGVFLFCR